MLRQLFYTFVVAVVSTSVLFAAEWTVFHGPKGDNKSPDTGLLKEWGANGPKLLWTADFLGIGYSSVTIADGRIFTSGNVYRNGQFLTMIFCLDMDGNKIWENNNGPAHTAPHPGSRATPTINGDRVYAVSVLGQVTCYNAETGEKIWSRNLMRDYDAPMPIHFPGHTVVVDGDNLICMVGGATTLAVALNKWTGETVWRSAPVAISGVDPPWAAVAYASPFFFEFEGVRVVVIQNRATVEGLNPETGQTLFSIPWDNGRGTTVAMPIYRDGHLFLSTFVIGAKVFRLTKNADGTITPTELWHVERFQCLHHGLILVGDYVYGTTLNGEWGAINFLTGDVRYLVRPLGGESASIHYADGLIYALSENTATVILWKPDPEKFVEISRFELPNDAEGRAWAHPVVIGGRLYLRHAQYLHCYDVRAE
jgi:outer membrane protein assembly factor BamB